MPRTPHDALFKRTFSHPEHAAGELRAVLPPALARHMDFSTLALRPGSFVDQALSERHSDLLYEVDFAGRPALAYLLFEHQSSGDKWMALRLLRYMVRIWTSWLDDNPKAERLPLIIPVVLYHGESAWSAATAFEALFDLEGVAGEVALPRVPRFTFLLDDLSERSDEELWTRSITSMGKLALLLFKHGRHSADLLERLTTWAGAFGELLAAPGGLRAIEVLVRYILEVSDHATPQALEQVLVAAVGEEIQEAVMTAGQQLIEQGIEIGIKQGVELGIEQGVELGMDKGERRLLLKLLRLRFGELPGAVIERVERSSSDEIDEWTERVISVDDLDAVFAD